MIDTNRMFIDLYKCQEVLLILIFELSYRIFLTHVKFELIIMAVALRGHFISQDFISMALYFAK